MADHVLHGADGVSKALEEIARKMGGGEVAVGFMEGATYPDGTPVAAVAFWNEYGGPGRQPRPFFRQMIAKESPTWAPKMAKLVKATDYDGPKVLALMGEDIGGGLIQSINDFTTPGLAQSTILARAKGAKRGEIKSPTIAKPLIDTAHMINSIHYKVDDSASVKVEP